MKNVNWYFDMLHAYRLLPLVAYLMSNGPWRDCWIRYGYDPRLNREARLYKFIYICIIHFVRRKFLMIKFV